MNTGMQIEVPHNTVLVRSLIAAFLGFLVFGCTATSGPVKPHAVLDARMETSEPVNVIIAVPQEKITKNYDQSVLSSPTLTPMPSYYSPSAQATGLLVGIALAAIEHEIGEAIEENRRKEAEKELIPLLAEVDDVDFRSEFWGALEGALAQITWVDVKDLHRATNIADATVQEITREPKITIVMGYSLTKEHAFVSETFLEYFMAGTKDPAYKLVFKYYDDPFKELETADERINAWASDNGRAYRKVVDSAIEDTLTVLRSNFLNPYSSRQGTQWSAHDPDHEILAKESGFVVSVPVGHSSEGDKESSDSSKKTASGPLSGNEIKREFNGKTAVGVHLKKRMGVKSFHAPDGSYKRVLADGTVRTGKWWVDADKLCVEFDHKEKIKCRLIESDGNGGYKTIHPRKGGAVVHFKSLEDGDNT